MKKRQKLVSNSSSSSFVCLGTPPSEGNYVELEGETAEKVVERAKITWDGKETVYLTQFYSDGGWYDEVFEGLNYAEYSEGDHGGPYFEEDYVELLEESWGSVWILKEDCDMKTRQKLVSNSSSSSFVVYVPENYVPKCLDDDVIAAFEKIKAGGTIYQYDNDDLFYTLKDEIADFTIAVIDGSSDGDGVIEGVMRQSLERILEK